MRKLLILLLFSVAIFYQNCADISIAPVRSSASCTQEPCDPAAGNTLTDFYGIDIYSSQNTSTSNCEIKLQLYDGELDQTIILDLPTFPIASRPFCSVRSRVLKTPAAHIKRVVVSVFGGIDSNNRPLLPSNNFVVELNLNQKTISNINSNFVAVSLDSISYQAAGQILMDGASKGYCDSDGYEDFYMGIVSVMPGTLQERSASICVSGQNLNSIYRTISPQVVTAFEAYSMLENITQDTSNGGSPYEVVFKSRTSNEFNVQRGDSSTIIDQFIFDAGKEVRGFVTMQDFNADGLTEILAWGVNSTGTFIDTFRSDAGAFVPSLSMNNFITGFVGPFFGKFQGTDPFQAMFREPAGGFIYSAVGVGTIGNNPLISQSTLDALLPSPGSILYIYVLGDLNNDGYNEVFFEKQENAAGVTVRHKFIVDVRNQSLLARYTQNSTGSFSETKEIILKGQ